MPDLEELGAIVHVKEDEVTLGHTALPQTGGERQHPAIEITVSYYCGGFIERGPDDERVIRTRGRLRSQQPGHVAAVCTVQPGNSFCRRCDHAWYPCRGRFDILYEQCSY